jgi:hypothetical protein
VRYAIRRSHNVPWFVTCDDTLLKLAGRLGDALRTLVVVPSALAWRSAQ